MWLPKRLMGPAAVLIAASHCARIREIMVQLHWKLHTQLLESTGSPVGPSWTRLQGPMTRQVKAMGITACKEQLREMRLTSRKVLRST